MKSRRKERTSEPGTPSFPLKAGRENRVRRSFRLDAAGSTLGAYSAIELMQRRYLVTVTGSVYRAHPFKQLKTHLNDEGYPRVKLVAADGKRRNYLVHVLVARAFLPPPAEGQTMVLHKDGDRTNCWWTNLKWGSHADNHADKKKHGRVKVSVRKLDKKTVRNIRRAKSGAKSIAKRLGLSISHVREIRNGRKWKTK